jgi:uncharacterized membrane protein YphA (DoxX/SURF4 family)
MSSTRENRLPRFYDVTARALLSFPFLATCTGRLLDPESSIVAWSGAGLGFPVIVHGVSIAIELIGGALLVLGVHVWSVAALLLVYHGVFGFLLHALPGHEDPAQRLQVARDLAIAGGLLLAAGVHRHRRPRLFRRRQG